MYSVWHLVVQFFFDFFKRELLLARASTDHCFLFFCFCHKILDYTFQEYYGFQEYFAFQEYYAFQG